MMRLRLPHVAWILGLASLVAVGVLVLLDSDREAPRSPSGSSYDDPESDGGPASALRSRAHSGARAKAQRFAPADDDPSTATYPDGTLLEIAIIRAGTGEPVPDANVSWWPA